MLRLRWDVLWGFALALLLVGCGDESGTVGPEGDRPSREQPPGREPVPERDVQDDPDDEPREDGDAVTQEDPRTEDDPLEEDVDEDMTPDDVLPSDTEEDVEVDEPPLDVSEPDVDPGDVGSDTEEDVAEDPPTDPLGPDGCPLTPICALGDTRCADQTLENCERGADGCLDWTLFQDCAAVAPGGTCERQGALSRCQVPPDPCEDVADRCDAAGERCVEGRVESCFPDEDGCLRRSVIDCVADGEVCRTAPARCDAPVCGDGVVDTPFESCDTGEGPASPGCIDCQVQEGWTCTGSPSVCSEASCGNGILEPELGEECDDGNNIDGDGCSSDCLIEGVLTCNADVQVLSCPGGSLQDNNANGRRVYGSYVCGGPTYRARERVYELRTARQERVRVSVLGQNLSRDIDLMILEANRNQPACASDMTCVGYSAGQSSLELAGFLSSPGSTYAVVVDGVSDGGLFSSEDTTAYTLSWVCEEEVCGDGRTTGAHTCDHGGATDVPGCGANCQALEGWTCGREPGTCVQVPCTDGIAPGTPCPETVPLRTKSNFTLQGRLSSAAPRYTRPDTSCRARSTSNTHPYATFTLENVDTLPVPVQVIVDWWDGDGFLVAYSDFDPASPAQGCLAANDDWFNTRDSALSLIVPAGEQVTFVMTTFGTGPIGDYRVTVRTRYP